MTLQKQMESLRRAARSRRLSIRAMPSLRKTPYRAINPRAAKELGVKCGKHTIGYDPAIVKGKSMRVMDVRHEIVEFDEMGKGKRYKTAHKVANRKQRTVGAVC